MTTENSLPVREILGKPYARKLTPDESGGYLATIHEFPGCIAYGETPDEAIEKLENAAESWLEAAAESDYSIPEPADYTSASGRIALRISRRLHQMATERADIEGISLNQLIATSLATYLGQQQGLDAALNAIKSQTQEICNQLSATLHQQRFDNIFVNVNWLPYHEDESRKYFQLPIATKTFSEEILTSNPPKLSILTS